MLIWLSLKNAEFNDKRLQNPLLNESITPLLSVIT